jgi:hypothetical protein
MTMNLFVVSRKKQNVFGIAAVTTTNCRENETLTNFQRYASSIKESVTSKDVKVLNPTFGHLHLCRYRRREQIVRYAAEESAPSTIGFTPK